MNDAEKEEQFINVIEVNKVILYKVVNTYCKDLEDRKDVVQETILQLRWSFDSYNQEFKHSTWMYRIASIYLYQLLR